MPKVLNSRNNKNGVYVGRKKYGMHYGNPFTHLEKALCNGLAAVLVDSRDESITAFVRWLAKTDYLDIEPGRRDWIISHVHKLKGHDLRCWCAPQSCHADVLMGLANGSSKT